MGQLVRAPEGRYSARQLLWSKAVHLVLQGRVLEGRGEDLVAELHGGPGLPRGVIAHVPEDGCGCQGERACHHGHSPQLHMAHNWPPELHAASALHSVRPGPSRRGSRAHSWHGDGRGWLGKDIDEDLTGDVPQLGVGMDTLEQRLPQWLRGVCPQVAPGAGQGKHGPVNCLLFWGPVRDRGWCEGSPPL